MFNKDMYALGSKRSSIRELFEYGKKRANEVGAENVFDFSLGNPNVPAPDCVKDALVELANSCETLHGYTSAQGDVAVREAVAKNISRRFGVDVGKDLIYMTCGAAPLHNSTRAQRKQQRIRRTCAVLPRIQSFHRIGRRESRDCGL